MGRVYEVIVFKGHIWGKMTLKNSCTGAFFVGLSPNINRPVGLNSRPLLHNKQKCNHATKNTSGYAYAIYRSRIVTSAVVPLLPPPLFAKLAGRLLPDTSPHPSTPSSSLGTTLAASTRIQKFCLGFDVCTLPVCSITYAHWLPALAVRARRHILTIYNDFGGLLVLFIMATNELKSSGATKCDPHITIIRSMMSVFPRPTLKSFPFPRLFCPWETSGCLYHHGWNKNNLPQHTFSPV